MQELNPDVDEAARAVLGRMMTKRRDERYASCAELIADLQSYLDDLLDVPRRTDHCENGAEEAARIILENL